MTDRTESAAEIILKRMIVDVEESLATISPHQAAWERREHMAYLVQLLCARYSALQLEEMLGALRTEMQRVAALDRERVQ